MPSTSPSSSKPCLRTAKYTPVLYGKLTVNLIECGDGTGCPVISTCGPGGTSSVTFKIPRLPQERFANILQQMQAILEGAQSEPGQFNVTVVVDKSNFDDAMGAIERSTG